MLRQLFVVYVSFGYTLVGKIESIAYSDRSSSSSNCHIAINDASSSRNLYFHEVKREEMCRFAERCREKDLIVKVTGDAATFGANKITTIEHGNSSAKWWAI